MKKTALLIVAFLLTTAATFAQQKKADKATDAWRYEIECAGIGNDGTYLIKVWSYSKNAKFAVSQAKKNAVHGIIFKGFSGGAPGCVSQKALASDPNVEEEKNEYFKSFFAEGGKYMKFVSESADGSIGADDRLKLGKEYKIGVLVSVSKDALRQELEAAGIVRGLSSGF